VGGLAVLAVAALGTAAGLVVHEGSSKPSAAPAGASIGDAAGGQATTSPGATTTASRPSLPGTVPSTSDGAGAGATASRSVPSAAAPLVAVAVKLACIVPGGVQTVTVTSRAGLQVSVNLRYADGQMGSAYGGEVVAQTTGSDGTYRETWKVSPHAPVGAVTLYAGVAATSGPAVKGSATGHFAVAAHC
jgi:hypothetical protein